MIVVTGGAGFIGSNVVASVEAEDDIAVCDWIDDDKRPNLAAHRVNEVVSPDSLFEFLADRASDIEFVIHMGANSSTTDPDVDRVFHYNLDFSDALWRWCVAQRVRLIYASSASTYGDGSGGFEDRQDREFLTTLRPLNAYGLSKHAFDMRVARWIEEEQPTPPQWAGLKFFNVYGPNEYHKGDMMSLVAKMVPVIERGEVVRLFRSHKPGYRDGEQLRDFVYVKDVIAVIDWLRANPGVNGLFNVGSGKARSFLDLTLATFDALGAEPRIEFVDMPEHLRDRYQYFTEAPLDKIRSAGFERPATGLEEGVRDYVLGYLKDGRGYA
ncbi:ADP-glyceromanno-heptose 6-epimerase [Mycolicibacterium sp. ELW1]|uniref:ADP-glyceromanno-heptose 6-epimerase n=1 Tax=Mycobacteriaceae TaxID=1762 RepID=UPI0011EEF528|nr:ADP-glyceromanno-heptose 6-epimerase [Mycobacterium sp. ELW1]QEN12691.1 ADP-glyceromanno-heptose 6-epimerase [Mycobacterium sp. ELW1]